MNSKKHLIERNHPPQIIDYTFTKCFQPKLDKNKDLDKIIFTRTFNPNHVINLNKLTRSLENILSNELKRCFQNKTVQLATTQPNVDISSCANLFNLKQMVSP